MVIVITPWSYPKPQDEGRIEPAHRKLSWRPHGYFGPGGGRARSETPLDAKFTPERIIRCVQPNMSECRPNTNSTRLKTNKPRSLNMRNGMVSRSFKPTPIRPGAELIWHTVQA